MESNYVSVYDISIGLIYLIILITIANSRKNKILDLEIKKYYLRNVFFKFFFAIAFAVVYIIYYGGGDTTAYWDGAITLNNLLFNSPSLYLEQMLNEPTQEILGAAVLRLFPNMKHIPLIGEHVLVGEYNSQHYYFGIVNRKNLICL